MRRRMNVLWHGVILRRFVVIFTLREERWFTSRNGGWLYPAAIGLRVDNIYFTVNTSHLLWSISSGTLFATWKEPTP